MAARPWALNGIAIGVAPPQHTIRVSSHAGFNEAATGGFDRQDFVESLVVTTTRGSRHPPAIQGKLCDDPASSCLRCGQLRGSSLSWVGPPIGGRSFANDSAPSRPPHHPYATSHHHSSRTNALSSTHTRYMLGDVGAEIVDDAEYLRSWPVTSIAPLSHPPPHHHPPNAGNEHEITHAHTPRARSLFISRAHRHRLEFPLRAAAEFRFPCCWNDFSCFWRAGVAGAFGQFWPFPTTRAFRRAYNT